MKNSLKLISIFVFLLIIVFSLTFRSEASKAAALETNFTFNEFSRPLYLNNCARCHGADGKGDTELGRLNDAPDISGGKAKRVGNSKLTRLITKGKGSMPGFGKKLTKAQVTSIVNYVRGL
ncbi:MAG TPA: c-type cytochrome [Pyrinomonadaceae bacterium]|jgi:cytochrome c553|nr:c-type cytochrome [Pyrinomonadaceae bacterium]